MSTSRMRSSTLIRASFFQSNFPCLQTGRTKVVHSSGEKRHDAPTTYTNRKTSVAACVCLSTYYLRLAQRGLRGVLFFLEIPSPTLLSFKRIFSTCRLHY